MAQSDSTAVGVQLLIYIDAQFLTNCYGLCCECFVSLDDIEVFDLHTGLSHYLLGRSYRADTHNLGTNTSQSACYESSHRLNAQLLSLLFAHNNDSCCTVVDTGSVTCGNESTGIDGTKLSQTFDGRTMTRAFIGIEYDGLFFLLNFYGNDLCLEGTVLLSFFSL